MFPHDCTVYRKENDVWKRYYVEGVLWQDIKGTNISKNGLKDVNSLELYIPFSSDFRPSNGDMVLKGLINYEVKVKPSELYLLGDVRIINSVDIFDFGKLMHYKAGGK